MAGCPNRFFAPLLLQRSFPLGCILWWSGSIASIPNHFGLCDGTNGTPNMLDRFVVAGKAGTIDDTGGSTTHDHDLISDDDWHRIQPGNEFVGGADLRDPPTDHVVVTGTTDPESTLPVYYASCYIMRVD